MDYWVRLFSPAEPLETAGERGAERKAVQRSAVPSRLGWQDAGHEVRRRGGQRSINRLPYSLEYRLS